MHWSPIESVNITCRNLFQASFCTTVTVLIDSISDLSKANNIASNMVKEYGMSQLGRVYLSNREGPQFLAGMVDGGRDYSEQTAREVDMEIRSIIDTATNDVREILQRQAALMIQLPVPRQNIDRLTQTHAEHETAIARRDYRAIHETNDRFHMEFFRLCGNDFLWQSIKQYMDLSYTIRANAFSVEHQRLAHQEHAAMISLLGSRNSWALAQLCVDHIQYSKQQYLALLQPQESAQGTTRRQARA